MAPPQDSLSDENQAEGQAEQRHAGEEDQSWDGGQTVCGEASGRASGPETGGGGERRSEPDDQVSGIKSPPPISLTSQQPDAWRCPSPPQPLHPRSLRFPRATSWSLARCQLSVFDIAPVSGQRRYLLLSFWPDRQKRRAVRLVTHVWNCLRASVRLPRGIQQDWGCSADLLPTFLVELVCWGRKSFTGPVWYVAWFVICILVRL